MILFYDSQTDSPYTNDLDEQSYIEVLIFLRFIFSLNL